VLQERTYEPLGSSQPVSADVRIIAATNKHLEDLVRAGGFREDLYYRINVVSLTIPPLRERMEDIPLLVDHYIAKLNRLQGRDITGISDDAVACLMAYRYPGNVRELENIVERAFILCRTGEIERRHLPESVCGQVLSEDAVPKGLASLRQTEAAFIIEALQRNGWNRLKTAEELGIHKTTLFRKMRKLGIRKDRAGTAVLPA
jgi:transcriptional regulator with PAS, ATPase and Fis domain